MREKIKNNMISHFSRFSMEKRRNSFIFLVFPSFSNFFSENKRKIVKIKKKGKIQ